MTNLEKLHRDYDDALGDPNTGPNERLEYARDYIVGLRAEVARLGALVVRDRDDRVLTQGAVNALLSELDKGNAARDEAHRAKDALAYVLEVGEAARSGTVTQRAEVLG